MTPLALSHEINVHLMPEFWVQLAFAVAMITCCFLCGVALKAAVRNGRYQTANKIAQDIKTFRDNRCPSRTSAVYVLLTEAAGIATWHGRPENHDAEIEGFSRLQTYHEPRSHAGRKRQLRNAIRDHAEAAADPPKVYDARQDHTFEATKPWLNNQGGRHHVA